MVENSDNEEERQVKMFQRLADVSLRTSATTLTIIFAYTFATEGAMSITLKWFVTGVSVTLFLSIISGIFSLYGMRGGELRYIRLLSIVSVTLMAVAMFFALMLLVSVLWMPF